MNNEIVLIDGSSYLYRAFHALPPLTNSKGQPTGAAYGVVNMIKKLIRDEQPKYVAVVFDAKGKTFRDDLYSEYKAHRPPMPDDLKQQIKPLHDIIRALGLPILIVDNVEADDVIGTLAKQASANNHRVLISTGDKDMAQLVDDKVTLINTMTNKLMDAQGVKEKFGVYPKQIIDYLTLMGDTSDNIPGVEKVGPKTAVKWLEEYETLDNIIAHAENITGKVGENLRAAIAQLPLSKQLVTINCQVPLTQSLSDLVITHPDKDKLIELYSQLEFKTWLAELLTEKQEIKSEIRYDLVTTESQLQHWINKIEQADIFSVDTETTSLNYMNADLVGISLAVNAGEAAYIPFGHDYLGAPTQLSSHTVLTQLKPILENPNAKKLGQNLKYDMSVLARAGIELRGIAFDTMLESYVLNSTASRHDMDSLALKYLGHNTIKYEDVAGKGVKQITFNQVPIEQATPYAAEDADITLQLHQTLWPKIQKHEGLCYVLQHIEVPLLSVLSRMERNGVLVDVAMLKKQSDSLSKRLFELEQQAYQIAGETFNVASPKQLQVILFEKLGLPVTKKTAKGQSSTAEDVLQELAQDYPLPKVILEYRSLAKLKSTYTDRLPENVDSKTGRVHTSYHQAVAATGRLSSSEPNLQNIPVRTEEGRRIRQAFIAPPGYKILAADYSQIELRIMAHLSQDEGLLAAFAQGEDIHRATAAEVFGVSIDEVTNEQRRGAKAINFGLIYGMSQYGLAAQLNTTPTVAKQYVDLYFARYPGVKRYMTETRMQAHDQGFVETIYGRRLYLPEIKASNMMRRKAAERTAINAPMQGSAADIIKRAMLAMDEFLLAKTLDAKMIMQVHDELVFEVAEHDVSLLTSQVKKWMESAAQLSVPLIVDVGVGANWDEAH